MSYLQKENKVTIHKTFMKRSKLETYGDFGVMCHMHYGSSSSPSLTVNSVQQQGSSGGNTPKRSSQNTPRCLAENTIITVNVYGAMTRNLPFKAGQTSKSAGD
jgi:hypothetical protein